MQLKGREQGVALVAAILTMLVVAGILTLIFARTLNEVRSVRDSSETTRTLLLARGAANVGIAMLNDAIKAQIDAVVTDNSSSTSRWAFDPSSSTSKRPNAVNVARNLRLDISEDLQGDVDDLVCDYTNFGSLRGSVSLRIYFTPSACGRTLPNTVSLPTGRYYSGEGRDPTAVGKQAYAIPFVLVAEGTESDYKRNVVIQGEYVFEIGRSSFARYAYFTNLERAADGDLLYFNDQTMIDGPVHTNGTFAFAYDPWFGGVVTSAGCATSNSTNTACAVTPRPGANFNERYCTIFGCGTRERFVDRVNMSPNDQTPSYGGNAPVFQEGVSWDARYIPLPENSNDQKKIAAGTNPDNTTRTDKGITFTSSQTSMKLRTVNESGQAPTRNASGDWTPPATHQIVTGCTATSCRVYRISETTTGGVKSMRLSTCTRTSLDAEARCLNEFNQSSRWTASADPFNGVIYTEGNIDRLAGPARTAADNSATAAPAIASFAQLTITAPGRIRLTSDLKYEDRPVEGNPQRNSDRSVTPTTYNNPDAKNVLGVYSSENDVIVGNQNLLDSTLNAPKNVSVDAVLMSAKGSVAVENYSTGTPQGSFYLLGGMIQNRRGAFGVFSGQNNLRSGFNRVYTYDRRLKDGLSPPHFPTTGLDSVNWVRATAYGQREQVY